MDLQHVRNAAERHSFSHKGVRYSIALWRVRESPDAVDLDFRAVPVGGEAELRFTLHLAAENAEKPSYVLGAADQTLMSILNGHLPPGARELL